MSQGASCRPFVCCFQFRHLARASSVGAYLDHTSADGPALVRARGFPLGCSDDGEPPKKPRSFSVHLLVV